MASPWPFSRQCVEMWLDSAGTGFALASLMRATASRSEASGCVLQNLRFRARDGAALAHTARACERESQVGCGRLARPESGASKLGMGKRLLGSGGSLLLAPLLRQARRGRVRQVTPLCACRPHPCQGSPHTHSQSRALWLDPQCRHVSVAHLPRRNKVVC